jgi:competence protein ComEC
MALIYISCAWVAGIYLGSKFALSPALILIGLVPLPLLFFGKHRKAIILAAVCLIALFGGALLFPASLPPDDESHLQFYNDREVEIKGVIKADPEVRDKTIHIYLSDIKIWRDNSWQEVSGDALLFAPRYSTDNSTYGYGDVLWVRGKLETPPTLDEFDYEGYLERQGIYSTMLYPEIEKVPATGKGFKPLAWVYSLRNSLSQTLAQVLPEPQASLAQGIVLGIRYNIPPQIKDDFVQTGTAHILAISGINLSIIAGMLVSIGKWLFGKRRYIYIWVALSVICFYTLLTGMNPPVVRGAIMASLFLAAELLGRQRTAVTSLAFAAAIMVGISPQILWDASFQLSFLAMAGLIFLAPPLMNLGRRAVNKTIGEEGIGGALANIVTDSLSVTLAATIAVWPLIAHYFGIFSLAGPPATFLALPALPGIIVTGALAGLIGLFALPVAQVIGWLAWLFLSYMLLIVTGFASLPLSSIEVGSVGTTVIVVYYSALALAIWLIGNKGLKEQMPAVKNWLRSGVSKSTSLVSQLPKRWVIPPLLVIAILASVAAASMPDDELHISFLNVGEGDAILIQKGSQQVLVDGGPSPQELSVGLGDKMPFWDRTIELVILTHPHADHITGLVAVLERYKVEQALYPDLECDLPLYEEWLNLIKEKDIEYTLAQAGQEIDLGDGVIMKVLNPPMPLLTDAESNTDNNGVVLHITMGRASFLLTADIMWETEFELINQRADLVSTVLKVAHHGSKTSTTPEFLAAADPQVAVISVGENLYGLPSAEVMARLSKLGSEDIFRTDEQGTIEFITDGERLWVRVGR